MWEWSDKLKLGKSSAFVKRDLRLLPLTEAEFEADFFLDPAFSTKRQEAWMGMVVEREFGGLLAMEDVRLPPPTVNDLATLLAHAMQRPPDYDDRRRPGTIHLRDRPQWQELLPHLRQLGIEVVFGDDLPWFDEAVLEWVQHRRRRGYLPSTRSKPPFGSRSQRENALGLPMQWLSWSGRMRCSRKRVGTEKRPFRPMI